MDVETELENCLSHYHPIKAKDLLDKLHKRKITISRSQFYRYARKLEDAKKLERRNGIWYYSFVEKSKNVIAPIKGEWIPAPDFSFSPNFEEAHRRKREAHETDDMDVVQFPIVPFNWHNWSPYQLKVRLEVRVVLGGRNIGLVNDREGYYNGKALIPVEPGRGLRDGCFSLPPDCAGSAEKTIIEVRVRILDQNDATKNEYTIINSWSYDPKKKEWVYEPKVFTEDLPASNKQTSSWESLKKDLAEIGGYLADCEFKKYCSGGETFEKITVQGIMMLKGAKTMQAAAKIYVPDEYEGFLFTQASVNEADTLTWQGINYEVRKVEEIYDAYVVSYKIAKLVKTFELGGGSVPKPW